jgi:hypothetical protein
VATFELSSEAFDAIARATELSPDAAGALAAGHRIEIQGRSLLRLTCARAVAEELARWFKAAASSSLGPGGWEHALACASAAHAIESALARGE